MGKIPLNVLSTKAYIIYLRKSRADNQDESVEEVLAKHETMLQELAERELGGRIPEHLILREVVSGETIDERPKMIELLDMIGNPAVKAVLVVEPQRLSRGDLEDCGKVVNAFRYSNTHVMTLQMTYDLKNKMHRKFFEQELMRGNDYLEYSKEILWRGRIAAVKKGSYIGNIAPFGFDKTYDDIGPTLEHNEYADAVRLAFDMYVNHGKTYLEIARHLDTLGVRPMKGEIWEKSSIRAMLKNEHYIGKVRFGGHKTEKVFVNGEVITKRSMPVDEKDVIIAEGRHTAIVSVEIFDKAQEIMDNNPRAKWDAPLQNVLAGLMFCSKCGKAILRHPYKRARDRYNCASRNGCGSKSVPVDEVLENLAYALEKEKLPDLKVRLKNNEGNSFAIQQKQIENMRKELEDMKKQEMRQYELVEKGIYSDEVFHMRNKELHAEMDALKTKIFEVSKVIPKEIDYGKKIVKLKDAIAGLRNDKISVEAKNKLLKAIIKRIDFEYISSEGRGKTKYCLHVELLL